MGGDEGQRECCGGADPGTRTQQVHPCSGIREEGENVSWRGAQQKGKRCLVDPQAILGGDQLTRLRGGALG